MELKDSKQLIERMNELLRAELSAVETYAHALRKSSRDDSAELRKIQREHREAASMLSAQITELGGVPDENATTWKNLQAIADASGKPTEDPMVIKALKEGEAQDILSYEMLLKSDFIEPSIQELVDQMLLPRTRSHFEALDKLLLAA